MASRLHLEPLHADDWAIAAGVAVAAAGVLAAARSLSSFGRVSR